MNLISFSLKAKGQGQFVKRLKYILTRFGLSPAKTERNLRLYIQLMGQYGAAATFPITASVLARHGRIIQNLASQGAEIAVHGYVHTDYSRLGRQQQEEHLKRAAAIFKHWQIPFSGFRCPYLRHSQDTSLALESFPFTYSSNTAIFWDVRDIVGDRGDWPSYLRALSLYQAKPASQYLALPRKNGRLTEIPMSLPDDEALVDRLRLDKTFLASIWSRMLDLSYERGELFNLQVHPERITLCRDALEAVLSKARGRQPPVWIARHEEIAQWWNELLGFWLEIERVSSTVYRITAHGSQRATVLVKGAETDPPSSPWFGPYSWPGSRTFFLKSSLRPTVGLAPGCPSSLQDFLPQLGYPVELSPSQDGHGTHLGPGKEFALQYMREVVDKIESSTGPLVRFWPWPGGSRSALAISGDIDAFTLWDFARRLWEVR